MKSEVLIDDVIVRRDSEGRYCLNDIQRLATLGRNPRTVEIHEYLRRPETHALIYEIENTGKTNIKAVTTQRGRNGGTYVVKELIYAYAMWISPEFHLKVIRAYDRLVTNGVAVHEISADQVLEDPLSYMKKVLAQAIQLKAERDRAATANQKLPYEGDSAVSRGRCERVRLSSHCLNHPATQQPRHQV